MSGIVIAENVFERLRHVDANGQEYWIARELQEPLGYTKWQNFHTLVKKGLVACENSGAKGIDHFTGVSNMIETGKGAQREQQDYCLSRYGAYLTAMNGDPRKLEIAAAQAYFAAKTREAETVIPAQSAELEKLRLQLALSQSQERLASASQMLATINPALPAITFGKHDAVMEVEKPVTVILDANGYAEKYDGITITELSKRYGFGRGTKANKQCREWIKSMGIGEAQWIDEPAAHITKKLPREMLSILDQSFQGARGQRQKLVGE
ncbi:MAG: BRO family protein [Cyanobacteria bacterium J06649_4]